jgi:hypothetical protein
MTPADRHPLGGKPVIEALQHQSVPDVSGILFTVAILWGIWPVACGVIGAMRGQTFQGIMHGFLWGPFGVLVVLLSSRKYECPMCGKKTLRQPYDQTCPPGLPLVPGVMPEMARRAPGFQAGGAWQDGPRPAARPARFVVPPAVTEPAGSTQGAPRMSAESNVPIPPPAGNPRETEEAEKLRDWVNAD